jgi:hypothetical protein
MRQFFCRKQNNKVAAVQKLYLSLSLKVITNEPL